MWCRALACVDVCVLVMVSCQDCCPDNIADCLALIGCHNGPHTLLNKGSQVLVQAILTHHSLVVTPLQAAGGKMTQDRVTQ